MEGQEKSEYEENFPEYLDWSNAFEVLEKAHEQAARVKELIEFNDGIPPEGALSLLYSDPLTQGPRLFAANCASCHAYGYDEDGNALDGTNNKLSDKQSAPDLKGVGSREWITKLLTVEHYESDQ